MSSLFGILFEFGVRNVRRKPETLSVERGAAPGAPLRRFVEDARSLPIAVSISLLILVILGIRNWQAVRERNVGSDTLIACRNFACSATTTLEAKNISGRKWIHDRKDFGPLDFQLGSSQQKVIPNPEIMVKTVCGDCNNGWMSKLEVENIPTIGCILQDVAPTAR